MKFERLPPPTVKNVDTGETMTLHGITAWACNENEIRYVIAHDAMNPDMGWSATWKPLAEPRPAIIDDINKRSFYEVGSFPTLQQAEAACRRHARGQ